MDILKVWGEVALLARTGPSKKWLKSKNRFVHQTGENELSDYSQSAFNIILLYSFLSIYFGATITSNSVITIMLVSHASFSLRRDGQIKLSNGVPGNHW